MSRTVRGHSTHIGFDTEWHKSVCVCVWVCCTCPERPACLHIQQVLTYECLLCCSVASPEGRSRPQHSHFFWGILATPGKICTHTHTGFWHFIRDIMLTYINLLELTLTWTMKDRYTYIPTFHLACSVESGVIQPVLMFSILHYCCILSTVPITILHTIVISVLHILAHNYPCGNTRM